MKKKLSGLLDIFNLSFFLSWTFKVTLVVFADVFKFFLIFAVIMDLFRTSSLAPYILSIVHEIVDSNWWKWQNAVKIVDFTEQLSQITRVKRNKNQMKYYQYQRTFLLMIYVEKTSYFDVAPPGHTIAYKNIDNLFKNDKLMS